MRTYASSNKLSKTPHRPVVCLLCFFYHVSSSKLRECLDNTPQNKYQKEISFNHVGCGEGGRCYNFWRLITLYFASVCRLQSFESRVSINGSYFPEREQPHMVKITHKITNTNRYRYIYQRRTLRGNKEESGLHIISVVELMDLPLAMLRGHGTVHPEMRRDTRLHTKFASRTNCFFPPNDRALNQLATPTTNT